FVEAIIGIRASSKYPDEPPEITIIDSKGLDGKRQKDLITSVHEKGCELSSNSMLVALCEEAVEKLTSMNHPDGDCPMCLHPLVEEGVSNDSLPFMKLMSCFHCFHCECIIRWWNWLKTHKDLDHASSSGSTAHRQKTKTQPDMGNMEDGKGICPVCRKVFHAKDLEHVLDLVGAHSQLNSEDAKYTENDNLLHSDSENSRRLKFETILKLQQENNGLIEPKKTEVLMPGMFLPRPAPTPTPSPTPSPTATDKEAANGEQATETKTNAGVSSNNHHRSSAPRSRYRGRGRSSKTQPNRQWVMKENGNAQ
ncbi:E3 ubiquitin protein ligase RNF25, partial [Tanacetum coccineum]